MWLGILLFDLAIDESQRHRTQEFAVLEVARLGFFTTRSASFEFTLIGFKAEGLSVYLASRAGYFIRGKNKGPTAHRFARKPVGRLPFVLLATCVPSPMGWAR